VCLLFASTAVSAAALTDTPARETDVTVTPTDTLPLSPTERTQARAWELSDTQWRRYRQLMQGIRGSVSPDTISPIEVLGIHARSDDERRQYAEQWVRLMREDVDRILKFQHAYDAAGRRLYPNEPLIDPARLPGRSLNPDLLRPTDRVLLFLRSDCLSCDRVLRRLLGRIDRIAGVDIYLTDLDAGDDGAVRTWASQHQIRPEWVRRRQVTLNHDAGALGRLTQGQGETPYLLRRRGNALVPLAASDL
jgi:integrating conjugative element protein (TIGR03759 family)